MLVWSALTRKQFATPLLTSYLWRAASDTKKPGCCAELQSIPEGIRLCSAPVERGACVVQTFLKLAVRDFCTAVAADVESLVTNVVVEAKGQLADNNWPGDITGRVKGQEFAIDVFATRIGSASNRGQSVYKLIAEGDDEVKHRYYAKLWKDRNILVFFFGMDAEGRLC
uniref:Uncharacterized protein n=1 Tax=Octactis speculum TaxID=3111310 RepID=A0A7S2DGX1_9STRA|mmetsp:Transcript_48891/g.66631  ORF Transcript_48891/g.66631 Transcript_48891/m.66631 type:complete len:169 (+) Transcript_48891:430-936(+)